MEINDPNVNRALMKAIGVFFTELAGSGTDFKWPSEPSATQFERRTVPKQPQSQPEHDPTPTKDELMARKLRAISLRAASYPRCEEAQKQKADPDRAMRLLTDPTAYMVVLQYYVELLDDAVGDDKRNHIMESIYVLPDNASARLLDVNMQGTDADVRLYAECWTRTEELVRSLYEDDSIDIDDYNQVLFKLGNAPAVVHPEPEAEEEDAA